MRNSWFFFLFIGIMINGDEIEEKYMFSFSINDDSIDWVSKEI